MRIVLEQISTGPSVEENKKRIVDALAHGASLGADLVLLPEACVQPFGLDRKAHTESLDGPFAKSVRKLASELDIVAVLGLATRASDTKRYNTLLVSGRSVHEGYRKIHLFDTPFVRESQGTEAGDTACLLTIGDITFGLALCYDIRFPHLFSLLAENGATCMLVAADWAAGPNKCDQWRLLARARAIDTTSWVFACGQAKSAANPAFGIGHSMIVAPDGVICQELDEKEGYLCADLERDRVRAVREILPVLGNKKQIRTIHRIEIH